MALWYSCQEWGLGKGGVGGVALYLELMVMRPLVLRGASQYISSIDPRARGEGVFSGGGGEGY